MESKLGIVRQFQKRFPSCHVGGSIGLLIRGVDLKRSLAISDIDLTTNCELSFKEPVDIADVTETSNPEDFDYQFRYYHTGGIYTKVEINIAPDKGYDVIEFEGHRYNVSKLADIYFYKSAYAVKGVEKHIDDLITIATGVRPDRAAKEASPQLVTHQTEIDDLPF